MCHNLFVKRLLHYEFIHRFILVCPKPATVAKRPCHSGAFFKIFNFFFYTNNTSKAILAGRSSYRGSRKSVKTTGEKRENTVCRTVKNQENSLQGFTFQLRSREWLLLLNLTVLTNTPSVPIIMAFCSPRKSV